ncbi:MAG: hypothetical protein AB7U34_05150 [Novosphingobium sp.]
MHKLLFQSRWAALTFVVVSALAIVSFIGEERAAPEKPEAQAIAAKPADAASKPGAPQNAEAAKASDDVVWGYASDEDLMVDPSGFDPSPDVVTTPDSDAQPEEPQSIAPVDEGGATNPSPEMGEQETAPY